MIRWSYAFIDRPYERFEAAAEFWTAVTATTLSTRRGVRDEFATLVPSDGDACVKVQGVDGDGGAHIDLMVDEVAPFVSRALELGAAVTTPHEDWAVLASPAGQAFCVGPRGPAGGVRPRVVAGLGAGTSSRLDQVCVAVPQQSFAAEVAFWTSLTGWDPVPSPHPEFHTLRPPADLPMQLLLQRRDEGDRCEAHVDIACGTDIAAVRSWHESLGATFEATGKGWTVMRDPTGGVYCLTARDPTTGGRAHE